MQNNIFQNVSLNKEDNAEYYRIIDNYNIVGRKILFINEKIIKQKQPKVFLICQNYRIKSYGNYIEKLQKCVDDWFSIYNSFIQSPKLTFRHNNNPMAGLEERIMGNVHYLRLLEVMDNKITKLYDTTISNFIRYQEKYLNQFNFLIVIIMALVSIGGLIVSLLSFKLL